MSNHLFSRALADVDPERLLRTHTTQGAEQLALAAAKPPSNAEIKEAALRIYEEHYVVVDAHARCGVDYVNSAAGIPNVQALNAYDWKSMEAGPITPVATAVHMSPTLKPAVQAARDDQDVWSLVIGISESAQIIVGEEGGIGIAFALDSSGDVKGESYLAGKLGLDIDAAVNLNLGIWNVPPEKLAGGFFGLEVNIDAGPVGLSLGVFATGNELQYLGFVVGVGAGVGGGATAVGGYTWVF